ncbi:MAG: UvrD-helicase domain-containing protein, partial [Acutalibacteraceae bacterium]
MKNNWTEAQQDAIQARGGTLLVSAAAGSGKTSVLVERVLQRLTDPEHPTPANHLLIVTFTKAATSEMRSRLSAGLDALLQQ